MLEQVLMTATVECSLKREATLEQFLLTRTETHGEELQPREGNFSPWRGTCNPWTGPTLELKKNVRRRERQEGAVMNLW